MATVTKPKKAPARKPAKKAAGRKTLPRQTRAEFVAEVKAIAARIDSGEERTYSREEVVRELSL